MSNAPSLSPRASAELVLLGLIWGGSFLSIRVALDEVSVLSSVVHRVGWAALLLWLWVWWRGLALPRGGRAWAAFFVMGLLNNVLPFSLMAWGQLYIETGLTSILNATTAIFGVLVAALIFADERLSLRKALGVGLGFLGVALTVGVQALANFDLRSLAQLAVLAGTLSYALAGAWGRSQLTGHPPEVAAAGMVTCAFALMLPATLALEGGVDMPRSLQGGLAIGYYAAVATAFAYLLYYRVLAVAGAGNLMLVTLLIPPVAIGLGALVLGEALGPEVYLGFGTLALGLAVLDGRLLPQALRKALG